MNNPFFWLGISILLVAISLMALLVVAILTLQELARAARSAEKLLDTLNREMPATLQDLRLTGKEIAVLTDEVTGSMHSARSVVQQVDQSLLEAKAHAKKAQMTTRSLFAGTTAAFKVLTGRSSRRRSRPPTRRPPPIISKPQASEATSPASSQPVDSHNSLTRPTTNTHQSQPTPAPIPPESSPDE